MYYCKSLMMLFFLAFFSTINIYAAVKNPNIEKKTTKLKDKVELTIDQQQLLTLYASKKITKADLKKIKQQTLAMAQKSVPTLVQVIKSKDYSDRSRWLAIFMLGRVMGRKSADYIAHYTRHPNWMLRVAALKVLTALDQKQFISLFGQRLKDKSMVVKIQALESIQKLKLSRLGPYVWKMLFDENNYVKTAGKRKRTQVIAKAIRTLGAIEYKAAQKPLLAMTQSRRYNDLFEHVDWSLNQISKNSSPQNAPIGERRKFWAKQIKTMTTKKKEV